MDDKKDSDNQDLTVNSDGSMDEGQKVEVKTEPSSIPVTDANEESAETKDSEENPAAAAPPEPGEEKPEEAPAEAEEVPENEAVGEVKEAPAEENEPTMPPVVPVDPTNTTVSEDLVPPSARQGDQPAAQSAEAATAATLAAANNSPKSEHHNNKKFGVIVVIVIALILASVAVYLFTAAEDNTEETDTMQSQETSQVEEQVEDAAPATVSDVDKALVDLDATVDSLDDASDFSEESLSDDSLGL